MLAAAPACGKRFCRLIRLNNPNNSTSEAITAIILAGGLGTRMHSIDKTQLQWRGRPFIEHIVERLQSQADSIAISTNSADESLKRLGLPLLADSFPDRRGPLAGILAGLKYSTTALTLIVPCDNPMLSEHLAQRLGTALNDSRATIAYAACDADHHYLYALLRSDLRDSLASFLQQGDFAVRRWFASENAVAVDFSDESECFLNFNSPADLQQLPE